jgi:hypothetical protein
MTHHLAGSIYFLSFFFAISGLAQLIQFRANFIKLDILWHNYHETTY